MNRRRLQVLGLVAVLLGFGLVAAGGSLPGIGESYGYLVVVLLSIVAILVGVGRTIDRRVADPDRWRPADTEPGYRVPVPGDELADARSRERKERLRHRVVASLVGDLDCTRSDARAHVEDGTWTDDRLAAAYLGSDSVRVPFTTHLASLVRGDPVERRALRRTVAALRELRRKNHETQGAGP